VFPFLPPTHWFRHGPPATGIERGNPVLLPARSSQWWAVPLHSQGTQMTDDLDAAIAAALAEMEGKPLLPPQNETPRNAVTNQPVTITIKGTWTDPHNGDKYDVQRDHRSSNPFR
jgi:hypothetical protein